jgi:hypothetical protein
MKNKGTQTKIHYQQIVPENSSKKPSKSLWRKISNDWLPTNISSHVGGIKNDLREGTTQISEL